MSNRYQHALEAMEWGRTMNFTGYPCLKLNLREGYIEGVLTDVRDHLTLTFTLIPGGEVRDMRERPFGKQQEFRPSHPQAWVSRRDRILQKKEAHREAGILRYLQNLNS